VSSLVKILAILVARPGKTGELKTLLSGMVAPSRAEAGNLKWDIWQVQSVPNRFVLDELYTDSAAVAAHRETRHFKEYVGRINDLAERTPLVLDPIEVA
jgi:quinol monooxygenase YgiN